MTLAAAKQERARRPKDRRATIMAVSAELFAGRGYAATGIGDIAELVGVTPGAIYRHFSGKEDLLQAIFSDILAEFCDAAVPAAGAAPQDALQEVVTRSVRLAMARPHQVTAYFTERRAVPETADAQLREGERRLGRQWEAVIRAVVPDVSRLDAGLRERAVNGALEMLAARRTDIPAQRLTTLFTQALLAVLTAPAAPGARPDAAPVRRTWAAPQSRRQQIRQAAALLFRRYGYRQVGVDQIGKAAGVSGPTVYGTYDSKAEILADVYDYAVIKTEIEVERAIARAGSAAEALTLIMGVYAEIALDDANVVALLARELDELPEADQVRLRNRRAGMHTMCVTVLRQVRPELSEPEARLLFAAARSAAHRVALMRRGSEVPTVRAVTDLLVLLLLGA